MRYKRRRRCTVSLWEYRHHICEKSFGTLCYQSHPLGTLVWGPGPKYAECVHGEILTHYEMMADYPFQTLGDFMKYIKAKANKAAAKPSKLAADDNAFRLTHPALEEYMTLRLFPDGSVRQTSSLVIFCEDGMFKICLTDRQTDESTWSSSSTLAGALAVLDEALQSGACVWRAKKPLNGSGKPQGRK